MAPVLRKGLCGPAHPSFTPTWPKACTRIFSHGRIISTPGDGAETAVSRLDLSAVATRAICRHVEAAYPEEACGALLGREAGDCELQILTALPVTNAQMTERGRRYLIEAADVLSLERRASALDLEVIGYYHSHPDAPALPSETDREHAWPSYVYLIVSASRRGCASWRAWRLAEHRGAFHPIVVCFGERTGKRAEPCRL